MSNIDKSWVRERMDQAMQELEQAPRMVKFLDEQLAIHMDSCPACLSRGYCRERDLIAYRARAWDQKAEWAQHHQANNTGEEGKDVC